MPDSGLPAAEPSVVVFKKGEEYESKVKGGYHMGALHAATLSPGKCYYTLYRPCKSRMCAAAARSVGAYGVRIARNRYGQK